MPLPLDHWHERLDGHFRSLAEARGSEMPIFAFEHPLTPAEVAELSSELRKQMATCLRLGRYWLPWVVYATEIGYRYTGDEYWPPFEERMPGWELHHRNALRDRFRKFQATYNGVRPSGPWAEHFSLIAWPITHAILPRLLQHQFASLVYQLRFQLAGLDTLDSLSAGRLIATYCEQTSTRFQQFLQQEELTGRILFGLLGLAQSGGLESIYQPTLQRIVTDLNALRATRAWLKDARTVVDRFTGIGQGSGILGNRPRTGSAPDHVHPSIHWNVRPRVFLRYAGKGTWTAALEIPSFAPVADLHSDFRSLLKETRCSVAGSPGAKPAGWVLSRNPVAILKSWPSPGAPLLAFEKSHPILDHLVKTECVLPLGPFWVFRIGPDGIAREILSRAVRPGFDYIILSTSQLPATNALSRESIIECDGVRAIRVSLPQNLSARDMRWLYDAGLTIARTIRVWPAGLPCRGWNGEGRSEWLTTEEPCFGIAHDHPVSSYVLKLNGVNQGTIPAPKEGVPAFVRLRPLPVGKHRLNITAERHASIADIARNDPPRGFVELLVREPEPWIPGIPAHTGLIVRVEPHDADLDEFWENKVSVIVTGPESHTVDCSVALESSDGNEVFSGLIDSHIALPMMPKEWQKRFTAFLNDNEEVANWRFPEAAAGRLCIRAGELGEFTIRFHRNIQPVRWSTRREDGRIWLRLLDDTGLEGDAECDIFSMRNPISTGTSSSSEILSGIWIRAPGALVVGRHGEHQDILIVSDVLARGGLEDLGVDPDTSDIESGRVTLADAIRTLCLWLDARLVGPLAEIRRKQVTTKLVRTIYAKLCGRQWASSEERFLEDPSVSTNMYALQHKVHSRVGFASSLRKDHLRILDDLDQSIAWYAALAQRYAVCKDTDVCEFAVRLAMFPQSVPKRYGSGLEKLTKQSAAVPAVIRGARFAALLCSQFALAESE